MTQHNPDKRMERPDEIWWCRHIVDKKGLPLTIEKGRLDLCRSTNSEFCEGNCYDSKPCDVIKGTITWGKAVGIWKGLTRADMEHLATSGVRSKADFYALRSREAELKERDTTGRPVCSQCDSIEQKLKGGKYDREDRLGPKRI